MPSGPSGALLTGGAWLLMCGSARRLVVWPGLATAHGHRSPPVPSGPSGALHTGGAWSLMCGSARRLEARPGLATAHRTSAT